MLSKHYIQNKTDDKKEGKEEGREGARERGTGTKQKTRVFLILVSAS